MSSSKIILYVEDGLDDRFLFIKASQRAGASYQVRTVEHGKQAVEYLGGGAAYANRAEFPLADMVLLDLKMPVLDGFSVLRWIRQQPEMAKLPVVVFTSSYQHADVVRGYGEGATAFLTKPAMLDDLVRVAEALDKSFVANGFTTEPLKTLPQFKRA